VDIDTVDNHPMKFRKFFLGRGGGGFLVNVIVTDDQITVLLEGDTIPCYFQGGDMWFGIQSIKN
jgi:hypothetical protein